MPLPEVRLACARPASIDAAGCEELARALDTNEQDALRRLRHDADRCAYIVAHAMLRAMVAGECRIAPSGIELRHDLKGRPYVAQAPELHVSLSRSREAVACAVTLSAPVGVDIERIDARPADAGLLGAFVIAHQPMTRRAFFFQWTALEAFWKACGTGLADGNDRIACVPRTPSRFDVHLEHGKGGCAGRGAVVHAYDDCALSVVLLAPAVPDFVLKRTDCASAVDIQQLSRAHSAHERFFAA